MFEDTPRFQEQASGASDLSQHQLEVSDLDLT